MNIAELILIATGLSMDAFTVSVCKGVSLKKFHIKHAILIGIWFGVFQAMMPLLGFQFGRAFEMQMVRIDHWLAFVLFTIIGGNMIYASFQEEENTNDALDVFTMFLLAIATSIDAFVVGITFAVLPNIPIYFAVSCIGVITFFLSAFGARVGNMFGRGKSSLAERFGGIVLLLLGLKILLRHLHVI